MRERAHKEDGDDERNKKRFRNAAEPFLLTKSARENPFTRLQPKVRKQFSSDVSELIHGCRRRDCGNQGDVLNTGLDIALDRRNTLGNRAERTILIHKVLKWLIVFSRNGTQGLLSGVLVGWRNTKI